MKKILLGCAAAIFSAGIANATDLPAKAPNIYKATPAFSWSGFYAGVHGGYGWVENEISVNIVIPASGGTFKPTGGFGGVQIGYNSQFAPHWLIGGEIDFSGGSLSERMTFSNGTVGRDKIDYFGSARTRFGYVIDRTLLYATGGVAWMHDKSRNALGAAIFTDSAQSHVGWTIGGGLEYAFDPRWSFKVEYLYASFGKNTDRTGDGAVRRTFDANLNTVKAGVNYRFGEFASPPSYLPAKAVAPRAGWNGSYIGVHGGYGWADYHAVDGRFIPAQTGNLNPKGGFGGFQGGANWQFAPNWLLGIETDASFGDLKDNGLTTPGVVALGPLAISTKLQGLGTARARFGCVADNVLVYATGGAAYGREKSTAVFLGTPFTSKEDHFGWTVGGGVEYKFAPEWSAKIEYLYLDLGKNRFDSRSPIFMKNSDITANTVKVGINYSGPVIERFFTGR
jgi:outer membrane immunogenic protein